MPVHYDRYDEVIVRRILSGHYQGLKITRIPTQERAEVVRRMVHQRYSDGQIAYWTGQYRRTVARVRKRLSLPPAVQKGTNNYGRWHDTPARPSAAG